MNSIQELELETLKNRKSSLYICAGGFEQRVRGVIDCLQKSTEKIFRYSFILEYTTHKTENKDNLSFMEKSLKKYSIEHLKNVIIDIHDLLITKNNITERLKEIQQSKLDTVYIDISGMTNFLIFIILRIVSLAFEQKTIIILYSEAQEYSPKEDEKDEILSLAGKKDDKSIMKLAENLRASGASETLIPAEFRGSFREDFPIALIFLAGFEPSRAVGLLEEYRPTIVIPLYGISPHKHFKWRTDLSVKLHKKFEVFKQITRPVRSRKVSTFDIAEIFNELESIYLSEVEGQVLYENYNVAITPQNSKLQAVATYQFCIAHPDVQVVFCLPGWYNPKRYSEGIGKSWSYALPNQYI